LGSLPPGDAAFAVEACTGWRFVAEELAAAGVAVHLAEPADTATLRGRKRRAKTDRADARHLRELLEQGRLPESWAPPVHLLDLRELVRLRKTLSDQRVQWQQRIHAVPFHHGLPKPAHALTSGCHPGLAATPYRCRPPSGCWSSPAWPRSTRPRPTPPIDGG
jgi:transposase